MFNGKVFILGQLWFLGDNSKTVTCGDQNQKQFCSCEGNLPGTNILQKILNVFLLEILHFMIKTVIPETVSNQIFKL